MKTNKRRFPAGIVAGLLAPAILFLPTAQAADAVQWADLPKKIGHGKLRSDERENRRYSVVTKDGQTEIAYTLSFSATDVRLNESGPSIPREQVAEIRIHRDGRWLDAFFAPAGAILDVCSGEGYVLVFLAMPVALGVTVAASPITLPIEGVKRLLPDKVIKVAP